jgi:hypothetical protein
MPCNMQHRPLKTTLNRHTLIVSEVSVWTGTCRHKRSHNCALILHYVSYIREVDRRCIKYLVHNMHLYESEKQSNSRKMTP